MASFCCCFHVQDDNSGSNTRNHDYSCPKCTLQNLLTKYRNLFIRGGSASEAAFNNSPDSSLPNDRAVLNNGNPECLQAEPLQQSDIHGKLDLPQEHKNDESKSDMDSTQFQSVSSSKLLSSTVENGIRYEFSSPDDEDECPTCLEEYSPDNPKITAECSHHFHLSCIYEWMERSETCPVCGKIMMFDE